jgi:hypothetical protein
VLKRILIANLILACVYAVVLFVMVYLSAWNTLGSNRENRPRQFESYAIVNETIHAVDIFKGKHGKLPADLRSPELLKIATIRGRVPVSTAGFVDAWGHPLEYEMGGDKFTVSSLGRDGTPGGAGLDADICGPDANNPMAIAGEVGLRVGPSSRRFGNFSRRGIRRRSRVAAF